MEHVEVKLGTPHALKKSGDDFIVFSRIAAQILKISVPRNPIVAHMMKRKAGSHRKTNKQLRKQLNKLVREPFVSVLGMFTKGPVA